MEGEIGNPLSKDGGTATISCYEVFPRIRINILFQSGIMKGPPDHYQSQIIDFCKGSMMHRQTTACTQFDRYRLNVKSTFCDCTVFCLCTTYLFIVFIKKEFKHMKNSLGKVLKELTMKQYMLFCRRASRIKLL